MTNRIILTYMWLLKLEIHAISQFHRLKFTLIFKHEKSFEKHKLNVKKLEQ